MTAGPLLIVANIFLLLYYNRIKVNGANIHSVTETKRHGIQNPEMTNHTNQMKSANTNYLHMRSHWIDRFAFRTPHKFEMTLGFQLEKREKEKTRCYLFVRPNKDEKLCYGKAVTIRYAWEILRKLLGIWDWVFFFFEFECFTLIFSSHLDNFIWKIADGQSIVFGQKSQKNG